MAATRGDLAKNNWDDFGVITTSIPAAQVAPVLIRFVDHY